MCNNETAVTFSRNCLKYFSSEAFTLELLESIKEMCSLVVHA